MNLLLTSAKKIIIIIGQGLCISLRRRYPVSLHMLLSFHVQLLSDRRVVILQ